MGSCCHAPHGATAGHCMHVDNMLLLCMHGIQRLRTVPYAREVPPAVPCDARTFETVSITSRVPGCAIARAAAPGAQSARRPAAGDA